MQLSRNKQLDQFFVRDLNKDPSGWALADSSFDAVLCCVSVQYLQQPEKVFAEIYRVLKPQGICIITFSNRLYSSKGRALIEQNAELRFIGSVRFELFAALQIHPTSRIWIGLPYKGDVVLKGACSRLQRMLSQLFWLQLSKPGGTWGMIMGAFSL